MSRRSPRQSRTSPPKNTQKQPPECTNLVWTDLGMLPTQLPSPRPVPSTSYSGPAKSSRLPPPLFAVFAGTKLPSTEHSSQRSFCRSLSSAENTSQNWKSRPFSSQRLSRRQQVLGLPDRRRTYATESLSRESTECPQSSADHHRQGALLRSERRR